MLEQTDFVLAGVSRNGLLDLFFCFRRADATFWRLARQFFVFFANMAAVCTGLSALESTRRKTKCWWASGEAAAPLTPAVEMTQLLPSEAK